MGWSSALKLVVSLTNTNCYKVQHGRSMVFLKEKVPFTVFAFPFQWRYRQRTKENWKRKFHWSHSPFLSVRFFVVYLKRCLPFTQTIQMEIFSKIRNDLACLNRRWIINMQNEWTSAVNSKRSNKNASLWPEAHNLRSTPIGIKRTIWFSNWNFRVFHVNGKHPLCCW